MSRLLVFGGSGRTGRHLCALAVMAGYETVAALRDPAAAPALPEEIRVIGADLTAPESVTGAIRAARPDRVVNLAGGRGDLRVDGEGGIAVVQACAALGVRRLVLVTSLGCGDSRAHASARLLEAIGSVLAAKSRAEVALAASALDWTIIRPGGLLDAEATGRGALYEDPATHGRIACADLARLVLGILADPTASGRVLAAVDEESMHGAAPERRFVPAMPEHDFTGQRGIRS